ncbi:LPS export ABC transporter permease LptF [Oleiagrimonas sp.]|jgi:lipopolysaccharide export system permease protein|uniref:LPS export ABC transporter permease LptF n=1 Tax=Oleiagrimonas sp. TaxID=2010330 RepID=UPI0026203E42|nr:LPS export ABC transporter permease LptF [Oleiagrimonas sp.]MDA3914826.1 LPS export ABC transporter permease LptF [Oleiagrimonas sp.]
MLRILDRYFLRQLIQSAAATTTVLLVIFTGGTFARVLQQVANGSFPASVMFQVLGLRIVEALPGLLPMALFLGVLVALGKLWRESEMHVLAAAGMGPAGLLRPVFLLGVPSVLLIALISLWLGPLSNRTANQLVAEANRSVIAAGLEAGRFTQLPGSGGVIFVAGMNHQGTRLDQVFLSSNKPGDATHPAGIKLITARRGALYSGSDGHGRYLSLSDGWQYQIPLGHPNWRRMRYQRNDVALSAVQPHDETTSNPLNRASTLELMGSKDAGARAELAWRLAVPITALVLLVLAVPLARQSPREPRYGRLLIAVLAYLLYFLLLSLARALIERGSVSNGAPMWALHLIVTLLAVWMLRRQYRVGRPQSTDMGDTAAA